MLEAGRKVSSKHQHRLGEVCEELSRTRRIQPYHKKPRRRTLYVHGAMQGVVERITEVDPRRAVITGLRDCCSALSAKELQTQYSMDQTHDTEVKLRRVRKFCTYLPTIWMAVLILSNIVDIGDFSFDPFHRSYYLGCMTGMCLTCAVMNTVSNW